MLKFGVKKIGLMGLLLITALTLISCGGTTHKDDCNFVYRTSQNKEDIVALIKELKPKDPSGIMGMISYNDYHVWIRDDRAFQSKQTYEKINIKWNANTGEDVAKMLDNNEIGILGLSEDDFHYIKFKDQTNSLNKWVYNSFNKESVSDIEKFINQNQPSGVDGIRGVMYDKTIHVWVRKGAPGKKYKVSFSRWEERLGSDLEKRIERGEISLLGFEYPESREEYWYCEIE